MKKLIGWAVSWMLYWLGEMASKPLGAPESFPQWWFDLFYTLYNRLMGASSDVQDWGGAGPWHYVTVRKI
jgi:hypothetical protein